jgi:hypothetical protein
VPYYSVEQMWEPGVIVAGVCVVAIVLGFFFRDFRYVSIVAATVLSYMVSVVAWAMLLVWGVVRIDALLSGLDRDQAVRVRMIFSTIPPLLPAMVVAIVATTLAKRRRAGTTGRDNP